MKATCVSVQEPRDVNNKKPRRAATIIPQIRRRFLSTDTLRVNVK
jgi:hypothetical protein